MLAGGDAHEDDEEGLTVATTAALATFTQGVWAQASSPSRAEVKAETRAAEKSGQLGPAGEAADVKQEQAERAATKSTMTRADRKAQTRADEKAGKIAPAGEAADLK